MNLKASLAKEFSMKDLGLARKILGMRIREKKETIESVTGRVYEEGAEKV